MGVIKASIECQNSLQELGEAIEQMREAIEGISNAEERGAFKYMQNTLERAYQEVRRTTSDLLDELDDYLDTF